MKLIVLILTVAILSCTAGKGQHHFDLKGIWVPENVDWKSGDFDTYYFLDDSSVVIISSVQGKIMDSIVFNTEPGFNIKKGIIKPSGEQFLISYKVIYRYIKIVGADTNKLFTDTARIEPGDTTIRINRTVYKKGSLYTEESKENIIKMATKMVADIEDHPEKFN